ncbi:AMP-binding protein, partial [Duganella sp. HSC-15S17]
GADVRVAICSGRGIEMVLAMLATLKAGGCYVPLDPAYPAERLAYMLADSAPLAVLGHGAGQRALDGVGIDAAGGASRIDLGAHSALWDEQDGANLARLDLTPAHLAYVIYTSGSTGAPKGVMVEHRNLGNLVDWHCDSFALSAQSRTSSTAGVAFDACAWEIWPALCVGAALVMPTAAASDNPQALLSWWSAQALDVSFMVTPLAELAFAEGHGNARLKTLLTGGDRLRRLPATPPAYEVVNNYGPTETTVVATSGRLGRDDAVLHIGRPIANTQVYILDAWRQPVPLGVAGELY